MKKILVFVTLAIMFSTACRMKEQCEVNNQGDICLTNNLSVEVEVYIEDIKIMTLASGEQKCVTRAVGEYTLKCFSLSDEWTISPVNVIQCEITSLRLPEDAWEN
jgi:hypothetical protein